MATKKDEYDGVFLFLIIPAVLATLVFSLYYFSRLKKQYLTGPHARRIFDIGAQGTSLFISGVLGYAYYMIVVVLYHYIPLTQVLTLPLGLVLLIWMGKAQAYAFLGVIVDYDKGVVFFRPNEESLDIGDMLLVVPLLRQFTSLDSVPLDAIDQITRQAGKRVFIHGEFGSRHISFTNKLKRDECIHLLTARSKGRLKVMAELE
ncbi:MAG: hypothetical protein ABT02_15320 [Comamonadaceae bacterium SCN 68-20]|mgnify:CR=1 FL=1|nr:MAG: hypothetical protein ABT02_15320 [Comamonadaceae bacterium SCN 68-20]OJX06858.1 MAG: hypothetical protein BGO75_06830 [Burkholderiales bacterium 68-20]